MKKYYIKTFGCQMNESDSERIAGWYQQKGWEQAETIEEADEIIINSCSVRESAENRVFGLVNNITKLKVQSEKLKVILTGCMLRYPERWLREKLPHVDEFKKISEYSLDSKFVIRNSEIQASVPIMEGCNNFCSYCVVPYARGREKSRPMEEIICEVEELSRRGYKEITLLGQNVNSYGKDFGNLKLKAQISRPPCFATRSGQAKPKLKTKNLPTPFAKLLMALHNIKGIKKICFLTSNPWDLDDDIIEAMAPPKIDRYLHLPVQSGDDEVLKKMNRKYTVEEYKKLVEKIRKKIPDVKIGTDIIVGFPGETEEQFQNTFKLCKKVGFVKAYISMYSPRMQTAACKLKDDVLHREKKRRWKILDELINKKNVLT